MEIQNYGLEHVKYEMPIRHLSGSIMWIVEYVSMEFRGKTQGKD